MRFDPQTTGAVIKNLRKSHALTQSELADKLCVSPNYIKKLEAGLRSPSIDLMVDIASFFGVTLEYLISGHSNSHEHISKKTKQQLDSAIEILSDIRSAIS